MMYKISVSILGDLIPSKTVDASIFLEEFEN